MEIIRWLHWVWERFLKKKKKKRLVGQACLWLWPLSTRDGKRKGNVRVLLVTTLKIVRVYNKNYSFHILNLSSVESLILKAQSSGQLIDKPSWINSMKRRIVGNVLGGVEWHVPTRVRSTIENILFFLGRGCHFPLMGLWKVLLSPHFRTVF